MKLKITDVPNKGQVQRPPERARDDSPVILDRRAIGAEERTRAASLIRAGDCRYDAQDWKGALNLYREAVGLAPDDVEARMAWVDTLSRRARAHPDVPVYAAETRAACEEFLLADPDSLLLAFVLARTLQAQGHQAEACRLHERATLRTLGSLLELLSDEVLNDEAGGNADAGSVSLRQGLMLRVCQETFRLLKAYDLELKGRPLEWDDDDDGPAE